MIISKAQMAMLESKALEQFGGVMVSHICQFAPQLARVRGGAGLQHFVVQGIACARKLGLRNRESLRLYLEAAAVFGYGFADDPQYPWATEVLSSPAPEELRAELLSRHIDDYWRDVIGIRNEIGSRVICRLDDVVPVQLDLIPPPEQVLSMFGTLYPEKLSYVGERRIRAVFDRAGTLARAFGTMEPQASSLFAVLMICFGHRVFDDPLYPWVSATITQPAPPQRRLVMLLRRSVAYLRVVRTQVGLESP
jgi:hypothetical protein